ncbi:MAG: hypothetical protein KDC49_17245 [Saprospiraceae bacterium]|nr:hypothetical protein [Saprospiraceae bacterium]
MKFIPSIYICFLLISCFPTKRLSLDISKSVAPAKLNLAGSFSDGFNRIYLYENNVLIRRLVAPEFNIRDLKRQNYPGGYGWYFIEGNNIVLQYYVRAEGAPYVIVETKGIILNQYVIQVESIKEIGGNLLWKSTIREDIDTSQFIFREEIKPDSVNPWVPIDDTSYQQALSKRIWRKKFNGFE